MRKLLAILIILSCVIALSGCTVAIWILDAGIGAISRKVNPDYEGEAETFYYDELSITLTDRFEHAGYDAGNPVYLSNNSTAVMLEKHFYMYSDYSEGMSAEEYAAALSEQLLIGTESMPNVTYVSEVYNSNGLVYIICERDDAGARYLVSVHIGEYAVWFCYFGQAKSRYEDYEPYFIGWASSVKINRANSEA